MSTTTTKTASQVRREFLDYFHSKCAHTVVPSAPVVPHDDPTLLFTNAGMNQFKDVFLGQGTREYRRAVDTQKCIRAGGKHNDLEDVGRDTYHHTFFEMLGNWSFGDYFKAEAIEWAWELLTTVWRIDPERLHVTVFEGDSRDGVEPDTEAEELWARHLPADRIQRFGKKDNFWEMGESGPCGPCSEIHYDATPDKSGAALVNADDPQVVEIWNLVFIQFNRGTDGALTPLPDKHVDTGMGFERIVRVLQDKDSNYDTDVFQPLFAAIHDKTGARAYGAQDDDPIDVAYRIIADHIRCLSVAIADGAQPSNEGRGYVLRRILRRAVRHARQTLGVDQPVLYKLVAAVCESLGETFGELREKRHEIEEVIKREEEAFLKTLDRGIDHFWFEIGLELDQSINNERLHRKLNKLTNLPRGPFIWKPSWGDFICHAQQKIAEGYDFGPLVGPLGEDDEILIVDGIEADDYRELFRGRLGDICATDVAKLKYQPALSGRAAFKLHDTYGFPIDLTRIMAEERGMTVDEEGYEWLMEEARERSRNKGDGDTAVAITLPPEALAKLRNMNVPPTEDIDKYHGRPVTAEVKAIWNGTDFDNVTRHGRDCAIILDRTGFYAEQGGQVGDVGILRTPGGGTAPAVGDTLASPSSGGTVFTVRDTQKVGEFVLHLGDVNAGAIRVGDRVTADIAEKHRNPVRANHTGTHLLNHALRQVLGDSVEQKGSLVAPDRLRFDFSSPRALEAPEVNAVERLVNAAIHQDMPVHAQDVPLDDAMQISGVRAVFGEKYPDPVRVVSIGPSIDRLIADPALPRWAECSIEFCGGTHLATSGEARRLVITQETALAAGIRRITAVTGPAALAADGAGKELEARLYRASTLSGAELVDEVTEITRQADSLTIGLVAKERIQAKLTEMREEVRQIQKQSQSASRQGVVDQARVLAENIQGNIIVDQLLGADQETLRAAGDVFKSRRPDAACLLFASDEIESKVSILAIVPEPLIKQGLKAGDWVRTAAQVVGGGGGGRPDMAQAGGKRPEAVGDAIEKAKAFAEEQLK